jgi:mannose-6-phosphate isomerase-like protein (cupin superfamily)
MARWKNISLDSIPGRGEPGEKKLLYGSDGYHQWLESFAPGDGQDWRPDFADQMLYCVEGEFTVHFRDPDGEEVIPAGAFIFIRKGQMFSFQNTGPGTLVILGARGEAHDNGVLGDDGQIVREFYSWAIPPTEEEAMFGTKRPHWLGNPKQ